MTLEFDEAVFGTKKKFLFEKMLPVIHVMVMVLNQAQVKHVAIVMVQDMYLLNKIQF